MSIGTTLSDLGRHPGAARASRAECSDATLLEKVRDGDGDAYGELYRRHEAAATRLARSLERSSAAADDLVSDSFAAILTTLHNGAGPTEAFRPYLLTTVRNRHSRRGRNPEDPADPTDATFDGAVFDVDTEDGRLMLEAYRQLPERWQLVLWHTEIEGSPPAEVAPLVGLSPHATAALAHRAREGLREAYLQVHLQASTPSACVGTVEKLGALVRGNLGRRDQAKVDAHLTGCPHCRELRTELTDVNRALRSIVAPLVLGGAAAAYLGRRATTPAPASSAIAESLTGTVRRAAVVGGALAVAVGLLVLRSQTNDPDPQPAAVPAPAVAADDSDSRATAGAADPGSLTSVALPAGPALVASLGGCGEQLGVAVSGSPGPAGTEEGGVVQAVLFRGSVAGLPAANPSSLVTPVTGGAVTTLRSLADASGTATAPADGGTCVTAPASALLAGDGAWRLLVAYQPGDSSLPDDLRFAVLDEPFALLGTTTRAVVRTARDTLTDALGQLPDAGSIVEGTLPFGVDDVTGTVGGLTTTVDDLLTGATGDPGDGSSGGPADPTATPPPGVPVPGLPPVTVPPIPVPSVSVPSANIPNLPLPPLPPLP